MTEFLTLFFGSLIAGLAAFAFKPSERLFKMLLSFGGAFLFGLSFFHLLPEAYSEAGGNVGLMVVIGFLMQVILESVSGGIEHGHHHVGEERFPWGIFIGLSIHAFLEGLPFGHQHHSHGEGLLLIGIMLHKMPVAFVLGTMLLAAKVKRGMMVAGITVFSAMAPLGIVGMGLFPDLNQASYSMIIGLVVGMLLHISTTIIYEADKGHGFNLLKLSVIVVALLTSYMVSLF